MQSPPHPSTPPPLPPPPPKAPRPPCRPQCSCRRHKPVIQDGYHVAEGTVSLSSASPPRNFIRSFVIAASDEPSRRRLLDEQRGHPIPPIHPGALSAMMEACNNRKVCFAVDVTPQERELDPPAEDLHRSLAEYHDIFEEIMLRTRDTLSYSFEIIRSRDGKLPPPPSDTSPDAFPAPSSLEVSAVALEGPVGHRRRNADHHASVVTLPEVASEGVNVVGSRSPVGADLLAAVVETMDERAETVHVAVVTPAEVDESVKAYVRAWKKVMRKAREAEEDVFRSDS